MRYAKLENDEIIYAKNPLIIDGNYVFTNDFTEYGYLPVEIPTPPVQEGYYAIPDGFEEVEYEEEVEIEGEIVTEIKKKIVQKWKLEPLTPEMEVAECKAKLAETDYKAIKYAEGWYTEEEYAPIKQEREALRESIRELENNATSGAEEEAEI